MDVNFVEIGTSDFDTLIEKQREDDSVNFSIEPIKFYLDRLPNKKNVTKLNCAISDRSGKIKVYHVPLEDIRKYKLPNWVRGCNSINKEHPTVSRILKQKKLEHILKCDEVDVLSINEFIDKYDIRSIKYLKIDTEGHDCIIIKSLLAGKVLPKKIHFESNVLTPKDLYQETMKLLLDKNYKVIGRGDNTTVELCE